MRHLRIPFCIIISRGEYKFGGKGGQMVVEERLPQEKKKRVTPLGEGEGGKRF